MNTLKALKRSTSGLDLYLWAVYRTFSLTRPQRLSWKQLYRQFGVDPSRASDNVTVQRFLKSCLRELKKIKLAWPELNYTTAKGVLILFPSKPAIAPTTDPQRSRRVAPEAPGATEGEPGTLSHHPTRRTPLRAAESGVFSVIHRSL